MSPCSNVLPSVVADLTDTLQASLDDLYKEAPTCNLNSQSDPRNSCPIPGQNSYFRGLLAQTEICFHQHLTETLLTDATIAVTGPECLELLHNHLSLRARLDDIVRSLGLEVGTDLALFREDLASREGLPARRKAQAQLHLVRSHVEVTFSNFATCEVFARTDRLPIDAILAEVGDEAESVCHPNSVLGQRYGTERCLTLMLPKLIEKAGRCGNILRWAYR
jgi:hypothetical protein